jgi:hypothetical protein
MSHYRQSSAPRASFVGSSLALFVYLAAFCGVLAALAGGLVHVLSPTVYVNPGLSAYKAPPATELLPRSPPPAADADQAYASAAPVEASTPAAPAVAEAKPASKPRKPQRTAARPRDDHRPTVLGYAPQNNYFQPWF